MRRHEIMLNFWGPDQDTSMLLDENHQYWIADSAAFWNQPDLPVYSHHLPGARIANLFLKTRRSDA